MPWASATAGQAVLLQGNAAMARGALEAGVRFCAAYPGSPSSEIVEILIGKAADHELHVEWSSNEKVAFAYSAQAFICSANVIVRNYIYCFFVRHWWFPCLLCHTKWRSV